MFFVQSKKDRQRAPPNLTPLTCADVHSMSGERWSFGSHEAEKVNAGKLSLRLHLQLSTSSSRKYGDETENFVFYKADFLGSRFAWSEWSVRSRFRVWKQRSSSMTGPDLLWCASPWTPMIRNLNDSTKECISRLGSSTKNLTERLKCCWALISLGMSRSRGMHMHRDYCALILTVCCRTGTSEPFCAQVVSQHVSAARLLACALNAYSRSELYLFVSYPSVYTFDWRRLLSFYCSGLRNAPEAVREQRGRHENHDQHHQTASCVFS